MQNLVESVCKESEVLKRTGTQHTTHRVFELIVNMNNDVRITIPVLGYVSKVNVGKGTNQ